MRRDQVLDHYFLEARSKLIDLAAFLDRLERAEGPDDFRVQAFHDACEELLSGQPDRAKRILLAFSDLSFEPASSPGKPACGAFEGAGKTSTECAT